MWVCKKTFLKIFFYPLWITSCIGFSSTLYADTLSQSPLEFGSTVKNNLILFLDNSQSMGHIVVDTPYDPNNTAYNTCPAANVFPNTLPFNLVINNSSPSTTVEPKMNNGINFVSICGGNGNNCKTFDIPWGTSGTQRKCFNPTLIYNATLITDPSAYAGTASYTGHYLNWYFSAALASGQQWTTSTTQRPGTERRYTILNRIMSTYVNNLSNVNVGLVNFSPINATVSENSAKIILPVADIATNKTTLQNKINNTNYNAATPLGTALLQIGRYFVEGYNNPLTLHPGTTSPSTLSAYTVFPQFPFNASNVRYTDAGMPPSPIKYWCQKNFVIIITDGESTLDNEIPTTTGLTDYDGDCVNRTPACLSFDQKPGEYYGDRGSDYLDDVATALYDMDLRPDLNDDKGNPVKNNVTTYTIGFTVNNKLLQDTAKQSGGLYFSTQNSDQLLAALTNISANIQIATASGSSVTFNGTALDINSAIYTTQYTSGKWTGDLLKTVLSTSGNLSSTPSWSANTLLSAKPSANRFIFTYNKSSNTGVAFKTLSNLSTTQQADLNTGPSGTADAKGQNRLDYLRGDRTNEGTLFRIRDNVLGDIIHSSPRFIGAPSLGTFPDTAPFSTTNTYSSFVTGSAASRTPMVYTGANDGRLIGFDANTGNAVLEYIPNILFSSNAKEGLHYLTDLGYTHRYYVDATPTISDAYTANRSGTTAWRTVLAGGLGAGGRGYYALDVTNPGNFSDSNANNLLLWEFSNQDNPNMGYSFAQPIITLMNNGRWAAIVGNGPYSDGTYTAKIFVLFLDGGLDGTWSQGTDYLVFDTYQGSSTNINGMFTVTPVDLNSDKIPDRLYAGDKFGNIWAFDVSKTTMADWKTAYGAPLSPIPLFQGTSTMPITAAVIAARHPLISSKSDNQPNLLVFAATGQFFAKEDINTPTQQRLYGIWDRGTGGITAAQLVAQTPVTNGNFRTVTANAVNYTDDKTTTKYGWYMNLPAGERSIITPLLIRNNVVFTSFLINPPPATDTCGISQTSGWIYLLNIATGGTPSSNFIDTNNDGKVDDADKVSGTVTSGLFIKGGMPNQPTFLGDYMFVNDSSTAVSKFMLHFEAVPVKAGKYGWHELTGYSSD